MPKGHYPRKSVKSVKKHMTIVKHEIEPTLVPITTFTSLSWWNKLSEQEQLTVKTEGEQLATELLNHGRSRLAIGEHLSKLQAILEPHNLFGKFLKTYHFNSRTAYRYIRGYENASKMLPESVVKVAMVRGFNIFGESEEKPLGIFTEAAKQLPPPQNATEKQAEVWLDSVDKVRKQVRGQGVSPSTGLQEVMAVPQDPETLLKETYRFFENRYKKLPNNSKVRANWVRSLIGMALSTLGVSGQQSFTPIAVPEGYKAERGRPRQLAVSA